jgi:hypothetical protein
LDGLPDIVEARVHVEGTPFGLVGGLRDVSTSGFKQHSDYTLNGMLLGVFARRLNLATSASPLDGPEDSRFAQALHLLREICPHLPLPTPATPAAVHATLFENGTTITPCLFRVHEAFRAAWASSAPANRIVLFRRLIPPSMDISWASYFPAAVL